MTSRETTRPTDSSTTGHSPDTDTDEQENNSTTESKNSIPGRYHGFTDSLGTSRTEYLGTGLFVRLKVTR